MLQTVQSVLENYKHVIVQNICTILYHHMTHCSSTAGHQFFAVVILCFLVQMHILTSYVTLIHFISALIPVYH